MPFLLQSGSDDEPRRIRGRPRAGVSKPDETSRTEAIRAKNRRAQKAYRLRCKEQLDQLENSLAERRQRMTDMSEHRGRLTRRREQLQQELTRAQATLRDLRLAAQGLLEDTSAATACGSLSRPASGCLPDAPPAAASPGAHVNTAAETCVNVLRANLDAAAAEIQNRHAAAHAARVEAQSCGLPLDHHHFDSLQRLQASRAPGYAQLQDHFGMH